MIEMKIIADNVAELHDTIRAVLNDHFSMPPIDETTAGATINTDGTTTQMPGNIVNTQGDNSGGELGLDVAKRPWDARVHSTAKNKNTDGSWKIVRRPKRFDVNPLEWKVYCHDVLTELSGGPIAIDPTVPLANNITSETENPIPQTEDISAVFGNQQQASTINTPAAAVTTPVDLPAFLLFMTSNADKVTTDQVIGICQKFGVPELMVMYEPQFFNAVPLIFGEVQAIVNAHG